MATKSATVLWAVICLTTTCLVSMTVARSVPSSKPAFAISCPLGGRFLTNKLTPKMKYDRYTDTMHNAHSLKGYLDHLKDSNWYKSVSAEWNLKLPMVTTTSSFVMIHRAVQEYIAIAHIVQTKVSEHSLSEESLIKEFRELIRKSQALLCSLEGVINGTHTRLDSSKTKYSYFTESEMAAKIRPFVDKIDSKGGLLIVATQIVDRQMEFVSLVQSIAQKRRKPITKDVKKKRRNKVNKPKVARKPAKPVKSRFPKKVRVVKKGRMV